MFKRFLLLMLVGGCTFLDASAEKRPTSPPLGTVGKLSADQAMSSPPLAFVQNKGQLTDLNGKSLAAVKYLLEMPGLNVQLREGGFSYDTYGVSRHSKKDKLSFHRVDVDLQGANLNAAMLGEKAVGGSANVHNRLGIFSGIESYSKVTYLDIYPGIDLEFLAQPGKDKPVEYNFIVHPGADASLIKLKYNSGSEIALKDGKIRMRLAHGQLSENIPASWIRQNGKNLAVHYKAESKDLFAFQVPAYDRSKTLVIDPTPSLVWGTYYGAPTATSANALTAVTTDPAGNVYALATLSGGGMGTAGTFQQSITATVNTAYVVKFNAAGQRLWATYYSSATGVTLGQTPRDIEFDPISNSVYVTASVNGSLAVTPNGADQTANGGSDVALLKLDASAGTRIWDTYLGGVGTEVAGDVVVGTDGSVYVSAFTSSSGLATAGAYRTTSNSSDNLVAKYSSAGALQWATYAGGNGNEQQATTLAIDGSNNVYLGGGTNAVSDIAANVSQGQTIQGTGDGFVIKFDPSGQRVWGRYIGGSGSENVTRIAVDKSGGNVYLVGLSPSAGLASPGAFKSTISGATDFLITCLNTSGVQQWATYYGTNATLELLGNATVDQQGNLIVGGATNTKADDLATPCAYQQVPEAAATFSLWMAKFSTSGARIWGTYFGGANNSLTGGHMAADGLGNIYFAASGNTISSDLATPGAFMTTPTLGNSGYLGKFREGYNASDFTVAPSTVAPLNQTACILGVPQLLTGNIAGITNADPGYKSPVVYQWQTADSQTGPWTDLPGETSKDLQPPASQTSKYYRRLVKVNTGGSNYEVVPGSESAVASVIIGTNVSPIANADGPEWYLCSGGGITLTGSATGGAGSYA